MPISHAIQDISDEERVRGTRNTPKDKAQMPDVDVKEERPDEHGVRRAQDNRHRNAQEKTVAEN